MRGLFAARFTAALACLLLGAASTARAEAAGPAVGATAGEPGVGAGGSGGEPAARGAVEPASIERTAEASYETGVRDEAAGDFPAAAGAYRRAVEAAPGTRSAAHAGERLAWLAARAEGGFAPLARLERVRSDPALARDPDAVDALARDAEAFPPGLVRVEARFFVASAWLARGRTGEALALFGAVRDDPATDRLTASLAEHTIVQTWTARGDLGAAADEARAHASVLTGSYVVAIVRIARRASLRRAAFAVLGAFALLTAIACARRRAGVARTVLAFAPVAVAFAAYLAVGGGVLASRYEAGNAAPFVALACAVLPIVLAARAWAAAGSPRAPARALRAALSAASVLAAAFVLLDVLHPTYLDGFGL